MRPPLLELRLRDLGRDETPALGPLLRMVALGGALYGAAMGSFACDSFARAKLILYAGCKVPLLLLATAALCLPAFLALNTVAGVGQAFPRAMRAILAGQAATALALTSLSPIVLFVYLSGLQHGPALLANAVAFGCAAGSGQLVMRRHYRALIIEDPKHRTMLVLWVVLYALVGTQMGWLLRPFVGAPEVPVTFFRDEPFSNAYVVVAHLIVTLGR